MPTSKHSQLMLEQLALKKEGKRRCCYCKKIQSLNTDNFRYTFNQTIFARACKICERIKALARHHERMKTRDLDTAIRYKLYQAKSRSINKRLFALTMDDVKKQWTKQNGLCFYTGLPLSVSINKATSFSIDRYDSNLGYIPDNIVLCCSTVNSMKKDMEEQKFKQLCQMVVEYKRPESLARKLSDKAC